MPKLLGVNLLATLLAALAMYFVGFVIYGLALQQVWLAELLEDRGVLAAGAGAGMTLEELVAASAPLIGPETQVMSMSLGFVISLVTAFGVAQLLRWTGAATLPQAIARAAGAWLFFAATTLAYGPVYALESPTLFAIDCAHLLIGYCAAAAVIQALSAGTAKRAAA
jgi:hypothetical protein